MSLSSRDYLTVARQWLDVAEFLIDSGYTRDGMYLAGYAIECSLKALILHLTAEAHRETMFKRISRGEQMHYQETLGGILKGEYGIGYPLDLAKRFRRLKWRTSLRYEAGRADYAES